MPRPQPLSAYPATTLHAMRAAAVVLLRYRDILPTDLAIKLDLLHGDLSQALHPSRPQTPAFIPRPAARPSERRDDPPERRPQ
jgi:hypothetical protein